MEGKSSDYFSINQGVSQGCTLSPTLFLIYINGLLCEIEKHSELGVKFPKKKYLVFCFLMILKDYLRPDQCYKF